MEDTEVRFQIKMRLEMLQEHLYALIQALDNGEDISQELNAFAGQFYKTFRQSS